MVNGFSSVPCAIPTCEIRYHTFTQPSKEATSWKSPFITILTVVPLTSARVLETAKLIARELLPNVMSPFTPLSPLASLEADRSIGVTEKREAFTDVVVEVVKPVSCG